MVERIKEIYIEKPTAQKGPSVKPEYVSNPEYRYLRGTTTDTTLKELASYRTRIDAFTYEDAKEEPDQVSELLKDMAHIAGIPTEQIDATLNKAMKAKGTNGVLNAAKPLSVQIF